MAGGRAQDRRKSVARFARHVAVIASAEFYASTAAFAAPPGAPNLPNIFAPESTPANSIYKLALFVLSITGGIFLVVAGLLAYSIVKFRRRSDDDGREPPQVYGSTQIELAWTVIPVLIVVVLFLSARDSSSAGCAPPARGNWGSYS